jgi:hypothetical protein
MNPRNLEEWEAALGRVLGKIDELLEERFGQQYELGRNRPARGTTANPRYDGIFAVEAKFSLGLARREGPGYLVDIRMATFSKVPAEEREKILALAGEELRRELRAAFPGRDLRIEEKGRHFLIHGDLGWE